MWGARDAPALGWVLCGAGAFGALLSGALDGNDARSAAAQDWPPFVLVAGLLLVGLAADDDGVFAAAGNLLARTARREGALYAGVVVLVTVVTGVLNLDTSVAFLTPVLVYTARRRGQRDTRMVCACLLVSNAASLLLPGANLTNLIVLGHRHLSGARFLTTLAPAALVAVVVSALVVAIGERPVAVPGGAATASPAVGDPSRRADGHVGGLGLAAVAACAVVVLVVRAPAVPVAGIGVAAAGGRALARRGTLRDAWRVLGVPVLIGLLGVAVALGTLGRAWSGPAVALTHLDAWGTAAFGALSSVVVNNLPAASLLAARLAPRPVALLVGLNVGPNLFASGSLAWFLWYRAASSAGSTPPRRRAVQLGLVSAPLAMAAALGVVAATGGR